jgi:hypothetical protein
MVQVFESAIKRGFFTDEEAAMMREAYIEAAAALELTDPEARRHLAIIVQKLARLEHFPGISALSTLAVDWYLSGRAVEAD